MLNFWATPETAKSIIMPNKMLFEKEGNGTEAFVLMESNNSRFASEDVAYFIK